MREQPLDLRESLGILRRRWIVIVAFALLGVCAGGFYAVSHLPGPRAAVQILLPAQTASGAEWTAANSQTQVIIVTSDAVLGPAATSASPPISTADLGDLVKASAEGANILRIEVRAPTSERAVQLATAVAAEYQKYAKVHNAVDGATTAIGSASAITPASTTSLVVKYAVLGLLGGLLAGIVLVLGWAAARRDPHLRRRDQIARAIDVPVVASVEAEAQKNVGDWIRLLERFDPSAMNAWALRRVLRKLVPTSLDGQLTIHVISFAGDRAALTIGPELALFAAGSGIPTRLVPDESVPLEALTAACATLRGSDRDDQLLSFGPTTHPLGWHVEPPGTEAGLVVSVVSVEPTRPEMSAIVGPTILSVSSGFAVVDDLARVALASARAGVGIDGIVVVNPDPTDNTTGLLPDRMSSSWRSEADNGQQPGAESPAPITGGATWRT